MQPETGIMVKTRILIALPLLAMLSACGGPGDNATIPEAQPAGASSADIGDHIVYFSAQSTDQLPPEIASLYNIVRSKNRAMLNVSIIRESDGIAVAGEVTVVTKNLAGQLKNITLRRIDEPGVQDEPDAIYYIGETAVANREMLSFDISVKPEGVERAAEVRFRRQFFSD